MYKLWTYKLTHLSISVSGVLVAEAVSKVKWIYSASMKRYFFTTLFLTSFAVVFYLLLKAVGVDLLWTMAKAQKWCIKAEWVHMDSTPFASLLRNMGTLFGLGLGLHSPLYNSTKKRNTSTAFKMGCILVSLFSLQLLDGWTFPSENHMTFYSLSFGKSAVAMLIPTTMVPWVLSWICKEKREDKNLWFRINFLSKVDHRLIFLFSDTLKIFWHVDVKDNVTEDIVLSWKNKLCLLAVS